MAEGRTKFYIRSNHGLFRTWKFGGVIYFKASQVCHIIILGSNYLTKHWQANNFFSKKACKTWYSYHNLGMTHRRHGNHPMNHEDQAEKHGSHDVIMAWSWPCFAMIMAWQQCFSNPGRTQNLWFKTASISILKIFGNYSSRKIIKSSFEAYALMYCAVLGSSRLVE